MLRSFQSGEDGALGPAVAERRPAGVLAVRLKSRHGKIRDQVRHVVRAQRVERDRTYHAIGGHACGLLHEVDGRADATRWRAERAAVHDEGTGGPGRHAKSSADAGAEAGEAGDLPP